MNKKESIVKSILSKVKEKVLEVSPNVFKVTGNIFFVSFEVGMVESKNKRASSLMNIKINAFNKPVLDFTLGNKNGK